MFSIRRRSKLYRVLRIVIRQIFYALKTYNKFSSIIASDTRRTKANVITIYKAIANRNINDNNNPSVSEYFHSKKIIFLFTTIKKNIYLIMRNLVLQSAPSKKYNIF